jgi:para-aminobenzoate synthetase component 1
VFCLDFTLPDPLIEVFSRFTQEKHSALLFSGGGFPDTTRYSIAAVRPFLVFSARGREITITRPDGFSENLTDDPLEVMDRILASYTVVPPREILTRGAPPPFLCGAIGYFGYGLRTQIEKVPSRAEDDLQLPDIYLAFYDTVIHYDISRARARIFSTDFSKKDEASRAAAEREKAQSLAAEILASPRMSERAGEAQIMQIEPISNFAREDYVKAVERVKEYILAGDVYQVNLSQRFCAPISRSPYELFQTLARKNPEPFAAYINSPSARIVSTSPERFLKVVGRYVETRPIKGTRPRGKSQEEDDLLRRELIRSEKDAAELSMIVDLERNDLGRVCEFGSVIVREHKMLEAHPSVFHLVSVIQGFLRRGVTVGNLLKATFPGGSITGAPKIRAMEIIDELEPHARGVYTGSIGYLGFDGTADLNIAIRTMVVKDGYAYFNVGGGIVADSEAQAEFEETLHKAKALLASLAEDQ